MDANHPFELYKQSARDCIVEKYPETYQFYLDCHAGKKGQLHDYYFAYHYNGKDQFAYEMWSPMESATGWLRDVAKEEDLLSEQEFLQTYAGIAVSNSEGNLFKRFYEQKLKAAMDTVKPFADRGLGVYMQAIVPVIDEARAYADSRSPEDREKLLKGGKYSRENIFTPHPGALGAGGGLLGLPIALSFYAICLAFAMPELIKLNAHVHNAPARGALALTELVAVPALVFMVMSMLSNIADNKRAANTNKEYPEGFIDEMKEKAMTSYREGRIPEGAITMMRA